MFSPKRKDNELLKAKRLSKTALAAFAAFVYLADLAKVNREGRFVISTKASVPQN